jgi:hypothetical protein
MRRFEATDLTVPYMNKQHGGYATGQLVALNLFRKRIRPSWQMLPRNCCLTQFAFVVIPKHLWFTKQERVMRKSYGTLRLFRTFYSVQVKVKVKVIPQQAEVAQGVPRRLRTRIFLTFGTTRVVGRHPYAPAAFTPGKIPGTHFQGLSRPQGTWFCRGEPRKKSPVTPPRPPD